MIKILTFGELLWDLFPDKKEIGGAPLNFSAYLAKMGENISLISAVGKDGLGKDALKLASEYGICCDFIKENDYPTGIVNITTKNDTPKYDIVTGAAYDHIDLSGDILERLKEFDVFYFGTLAQRSTVSRNTLRTILSARTFKEIFCDINIRQRYYDAQTLELCLKYATVLKFSREEIGVFEELNLTQAKAAPYSGAANDCLDFCREIRRKYSNGKDRDYNEIKVIIITLDKDGSILYDAARDKMIKSQKPEGEVVSAVGAGDSFFACFAHHYLKGSPLKECIGKAAKLSSYVITQFGAVCDYPGDLMDEIL